MQIGEMKSLQKKKMRIMELEGIVVEGIRDEYGIYVMQEYLLLKGVKVGIKQIMELNELLGGIKMMLIGMIGEYIGK